MTTDATGQPDDVLLPAPGRYRPKTGCVEAVPFTAQNGRELAEWCGGRYFPEEPLGRRNQPVIEVHARYGAIPAHPGDFIVRHAGGAFGVYSAADFADTYEAAGDPAPGSLPDQLLEARHTLEQAYRKGWSLAEDPDPVVAEVGRQVLAVLGIDPGPARLCPGGCGCRLGTDDADRRECGCDGGCCGD